MLGKTATVLVTVPYGSQGEDGKTRLLNFGHIKGFTQKGGVPLDAYVIGMEKPVHSFTGPVLAVLYREDRTPVWIVSSRRTVMYEPELRRLLSTCETGRFKLSCRYEKSCGGVLYTHVNGERRYLMVRNRSGYYGFPKGHIENTENDEETARREIREETGLTEVRFVEGFTRTNRYMCKAHTQKQVTLFLGIFPPTATIAPSMEIREYKLLPFEQAVETIGHENDKQILREAEAFLKEHDTVNV